MQQELQELDDVQPEVHPAVQQELQERDDVQPEVDPAVHQDCKGRMVCSRSCKSMIRNTVIVPVR